MLILEWFSMIVAPCIKITIPWYAFYEPVVILPCILHLWTCSSLWGKTGLSMQYKYTDAGSWLFLWKRSSKRILRMKCSCLPEIVFTPHFLNIATEVKASGPLHILRLWLKESKGMLPVNHLRTQKSFFMSIEFHGYLKTMEKSKWILPPSFYENNAGSFIGLSVCLS